MRDHRTLFTVAAWIAMASVSVVSQGAVIGPTEQARTVEASVSLITNFGQDSDADSESAVDFGPFTAMVEAAASVPFTNGSATATQDSSFTSSSITAGGSTSANHIHSGGLFDTVDVSASSRFAATFWVTGATEYSLTGTINAYDDGNSAVLFRNAMTGVSIFTKNIHADMFPYDPTFSIGGELPAGLYHLEIETTAVTHPMSSFGEAGGDYALTFQISGEALPSGGEVPDGKDVQSGPPLYLQRLPNDTVRLTWGASCQPGDTDYAVYEGAIDDPTVLTPVTCSTAGARNHELAPSFAGSVFLVVPTDGSTEGSYGNDSADIERSPSPGACLPQSLGAPVCP